MTGVALSQENSWQHAPALDITLRNSDGEWLLRVVPAVTLLMVEPY